MRKSAANAFYLAIFSLFGGECTVRAASSTTESINPDVCALDPKAQVSDACASYADLDTLNDRLHPYVRNLANNTDFFSFYRLNLFNQKCHFWSDENGLCGNIACAVTTLENEEDLPKIWRAEELSKLEGPKAQHPGRKQQRERQRPLLGELGEGVGESCVVEYDDECDDRDYCIPEDERASAKGDYVSLVDNPERFTGFAGEGAHQIWEAIYRENCFSKPITNEKSAGTPGRSSPALDFSQNQMQAAQDFRQVVKEHGRLQASQSNGVEDAYEPDDECLEKRVFYRVISGMHASISTHLCHAYLNQSTGEWGPNLECYKERLHDHPERISNLYFDYALVLRAVGKLHDYVQDYTFCTGDPGQDQKTKQMIRKLSAAIPAGPQIFDESIMFTDPTATGIELKEDFRNRFRNVSRIMDCVGCDKCRLWGKVQTVGFGTALKVLFEFGNGQPGDDKPLLRRTELVALINLLDKISSALKALEEFRAMIAAENDGQDPLIPKMAVHSEPAAAAKNNFGDLEELDDFDDFEPPKKEKRPRPSAADQFKYEMRNVTNAFLAVFQTWFKMPRKIGMLAYGITSQLWDVWLGKPWKPESMRGVPRRDEV